ncbi:hypothetical protein KW800_02170 [Candidatus Parcubacteria bacterium]|nr:hypothetical protein [Candidatus Parcubacteria bacterium]
MLTNRQDDIVSGEIRFRASIHASELMSLIGKMKENDKKEGYLNLYVRPGEKGENFVGFQYELAEGETEKKFLYKLTDRLKRQYGNDCMGWSISSPTWVLDAARPLNRGDRRRIQNIHKHLVDQKVSKDDLSGLEFLMKVFCIEIVAPTALGG